MKLRRMKCASIVTDIEGKEMRVPEAKRPHWTPRPR